MIFWKPLFPRLFFFLIGVSLIFSACTQPAPAGPTASATAEASAMPTTVPTATQAATVEATQIAGSMDIPERDLPWWNDTVFYEVFVRSFADSDGDGIGDFRGLTQKLDYLNDGDPQTNTDLGITGIWLMPIHPSPSYHGYDVTDYEAINPEYGTMEDFQAFLDAAHDRGIHVIIDLVLNHTSDQHPWFLSAQSGANAPYRDYYVWSAEDPGIRGADGQTVWHRAKDGSYYYGFFWSGMPDLNYTTPEVTEEMEKVTDFWLTQVGIDGFRLDAARHLIENGRSLANTPQTHTWLQGFREAYKTQKADALTVGEIWDKSSVVSTYVKGNELDLAFNFDLASAWVLAAASKDSRTASFVLNRDLPVFPPGQFATFLTNHDQNRVMNQVNGEVLRAKTAASLMLTAPGVPFVYYGEEIGMTGTKPDPQIRTPMQWTSGPGAGFTSGQPWEAINTDAERVNVAAQDQDAESLLNRYRLLIRLRNENSALRSADAWLLETGNRGVYAVLRADSTQALLVIINLDDESVRDYELSLKASPLAGSFAASDLVSSGAVSAPTLTVNENGGFEGYQPVPELAPGGIIILELRP